MLQTEEKRRIKRLVEASLQTRRERFDPAWKEVASYCRPVRMDWNSLGPDKSLTVPGADSTVLDSIGMELSINAAFGLHGWTMSQAIRWFKIGPKNRQLERSRNVSVYLQNVEDHLFQKLEDSNFYSASSDLFQDYVSFGQGCLWSGENSDRTGLHFMAIHMKRIALIVDDRGVTAGISRDMYLTKSELVERFGESAVPEYIRTVRESDNPNARYLVKHVVVKRQGGKTGAPANRKPWGSYYFYCDNGADDPEGWDELSEGGFDSMPYFVPRWDTIPEEPYGVGPGVYALPNLKMLNQMRKARIQAAQLMAQRPLVASARLKGKLNYQPRGITWIDNGANEQVAPLVTGDMLPALDQDIMDVRLAIERMFLKQLFQVLLTTDKPITAFEAGGIQSEQAALLGPVTARVQAEYLVPLLRRCWEIEMAAGRLPPPPQELAGADVAINFHGLLSILQARHARLTGTMQALGGIQAVASMWPQSLDNYDPDALSVSIADAYGMDQLVIKDESDVDKLRKARAQAQAQAMQAQQQAEMAKAFLPNIDKVAALAPKPAIGGL